MMSSHDRSARPRRLGQTGQSTVELAIALPVLAVGILAIVQVARVAGDQVAVHHAAREAARLAAVEPDLDAVTERASAAAPGLRAERLEVQLSPERRSGALVTVDVRYRSVTDVPMVGRFVGDVELRASAVVRLE